MVLISELCMCMSQFDRRNQLLCWYTDGINLCTKIGGIADEIKAECKRRNIPYGSIWTREMTRRKDYTSLEIVTMPYDIHKICIYRSPEAFQAYDENVLKLHADSCVPALKKKQLADWAITTFNCYQELDDRNSDNYVVWIQPDSQVWSRQSEEEEMLEGVTTDWVYR